MTMRYSDGGDTTINDGDAAPIYLITIAIFSYVDRLRWCDFYRAVIVSHETKL